MWTSQQMVSRSCLWWVPVESRRLRDGRRLKKYLPNSTHGDACLNGVPALLEQDKANGDDSESCLKCSVHVCVPHPLPSSGAQKCDHPAPYNPYISEMAFSHRFQKVYPPPEGTKFWRIGAKVEKSPRKC